MNPVIVIGITGGSGSGKTFLINLLKGRFQHSSVAFISQDNYYRPISELEKDENGIVNFDNPKCIDDTRLISDVEKLMSGNSVTFAEYTFNNPKINGKTITIKPAAVIVIEGLFCMYFERLRNVMNLKVFVSSNEAIMLKRRIKRDAIERNYDLNDVLYRFENHVLPAFQAYTLRFESQSDVVINNVVKGQIEKGAKLIQSYIDCSLDL